MSVQYKNCSAAFILHTTLVRLKVFRNDLVIFFSFPQIMLQDSKYHGLCTTWQAGLRLLLLRLRQQIPWLVHTWQDGQRRLATKHLPIDPPAEMSTASKRTVMMDVLISGSSFTCLSRWDSSSWMTRYPYWLWNSAALPVKQTMMENHTVSETAQQSQWNRWWWKTLQTL